MAALPVSTMAAVSFTSTQVCFGTQTTLTGSSSLGDASIASWSWDLDNDGVYDDATGKILNHLFPLTDTIPVGLRIITTFGTADSVRSNVIVDPLPQVNFNADNLCEGKTAVYTGSSTISKGTITQYNWDFNNDGVTDDNAGNVVSYTCGPAATYQTRLTCVSDRGCSAFAVKTTQVFHLPVADFTVSDNCIGDTTLFTSTSSVTNESIAFHFWDFGDGSPQSTSANPSHRFASVQPYPVRLVVISQNFCRDTLNRTVQVNALPEAELLFSGDTVFYEGGSVTLTASGPALTGYEWSTGATTASIDVSMAGPVSVKCYDGNGCATVKKTTVVVSSVEQFEVVNDLLTPNGDGINDRFVIENAEAYKECTLSIYNSRNQLIFSTRNYQNDWEGTWEGKEADAGAYYYIITCGDRKEKSGSINILR
jgi:gliding motility-associated-like protein